MVPSVAVVAALCAARVGAESTLPSAAFLVRSASWGFTEGEVPQEEVLEQITGNTECNCQSFCLSKDACLSWMYEPATSTCTQLRVRGNRESLRPSTQTARVRYRQALAYLGDWCGSDRECAHLTSGVATCQQNTCSCPVGLFPSDKTTCVSETTSATINSFRTTKGKTSTAESDRSTQQSVSASATESASSTSTTPSTHTVSCPAGVQYLLDETDCNKYYQCTNGEPVSQSCSKTLVWNDQNQTCDFPANVPRCS